MHKLTRTNTFEAAHWLPNVPKSHKCSRMHGHSYSLTVEIHGYPDSSGWIIDTKHIDDAFQILAADLDHNLLNDVDGLENPTTENIAEWAWKRINPSFIDFKNIDKIVVIVRETPRSTATYEGP